MHLGIYLTGPFGQSQQLYEVRNEAKRGRGTEEVVRQQIEKDTETVIKAQQEAGLDFIIDPLFGQYDLFQPLVEGVPGINAGRQENWFNNNLFYQKPRIQIENLQYTSGWSEKFLHPESLPKDGSWSAILPSPYTLLILSEISGYQNKKSAIQAL